jgi:hypothetical protein
MANNLTGNPIYIDTASATALATQRFDVVKIRWVYVGAVAGNQAVVQDKSSNPTWESCASGANYIDSDAWEKDNPLVMNGLLVPTLAGGALYIHLHNRKIPG